MDPKEIKRLPYGISNFIDIMEEHQYYVDKTRYIPLIESQPSNLIFIRPRRFGKSLLISMLKAYYDLSLKDSFTKWFGNLWIGQHRTEKQGTYQVLSFDFSRIGGDMEHLSENFDRYCGIILNSFIDKYRDLYPEHIYADVRKASFYGDKLSIIAEEAEKGDSRSISS